MIFTIEINYDENCKSLSDISWSKHVVVPFYSMKLHPYRLAHLWGLKSITFVVTSGLKESFFVKSQKAKKVAKILSLSFKMKL